ncbi:MAG: DNRLRE domain-containing protein, partial [Oscillospiraceae bacterium]|nr:DNRLRE domain-containing protein [Oscillospiraceae bacterium]
APYMYDSNFAFSSEIKTTLKKEGTEYILTYKPDHKWLTDEERAYPVTIDPTVDTRGYTDKTVDISVVSIASENIASKYNLWVGSYSNYTVDSYIKFTKLPPRDKKWIISKAKLNIKTSDNNGSKINAYKIKSDWSIKNVYKTATEVSDTILDVCDVPDAKDKWVYWDITNTVNSWYNGEENYGIKLSSSYLENNQSMFYSANSEDSVNAPFLSVEYKTVSSEQIENRRSVDIGRAGKAEIDDFSGNLMLSREDIGFNGKVMPVNISMIYNFNYGSNPTLDCLNQLKQETEIW